MRSVAVFTWLLAVGNAWAGNENASLVLHAQREFGCVEPCVGGGANVEITEPGEEHLITLLVENHGNVSALFCAFDWDPSWTLIAPWGSNCTTGSFCERTPFGPGARDGILECAFDCIVGGSVVVAHLFMIPVSGCISVIERDASGGTAILDCEFPAGHYPIREANRGRVCVGPGGHDTCEPELRPVESETWGRIKAQYR